MAGRDLTPSPERVAIVRWTARLGAITADSLSVHEATTLATARARLGALEAAGWLLRERPLTGQPALYTATRTGLRISGLRGLGPCRVSAAGAQHLIECARVAAILERRYPDHRLSGERELRRDERERGIPLASARIGTGLQGEPLLHRPDLVLWSEAGLDPDREADRCASADGRPIAVEVELTVKAPRRLVEICLAWARCSWVAGVLYLVAPEVGRALERAIERSAAHEQIVVVGLDAL
jgi:hypothetical protein